MMNKTFDEFVKSIDETADYDKYTFKPEEAEDRLDRRIEKHEHELETAKEKENDYKIELLNMQLDLDKLDQKRNRIKKKIYRKMKGEKELKKDKVRRGEQKRQYIEKQKRLK